MNSLYNKLREKYKKIITNGLGDVVEEEDKLICYVKKRSFKKSYGEYILTCSGLRENDKLTLERFQLNKPICYVIDGLEFDKNFVSVFGYDNCEVIIKNCRFDADLEIIIMGKCTIDNTSIKTVGKSVEGHTLTLPKYAHELTIRNMNFGQITSKHTDANIINFSAKDKLEIIDSKLNDNRTTLEFHSENEINIANSTLWGECVSLEAFTVNTDKNSGIDAETILLKMDDFNFIDLYSEKIFLNYKRILKDLTEERGHIFLKRENTPLAIKRLELIELLKSIERKCEDINSKKANEYKRVLDSKTITRVMK